MTNFQIYTNKLNEAETAKICDYTMITGYGKENGLPYLYIFRPRANKPFVKGYFRSLDKLVTYAGDIVTKIKEENEKKEAQKIKAKEFSVKDFLTPGEILYESWGYEQTNVTFYQVIKIKARTQIIVRQIGKQMSNVMSHGMACYVDPIKNDFCGDEKIVNVRYGGSSDGWTAKIGRYYLYKYCGQSKYCSWYA